MIKGLHRIVPRIHRFARDFPEEAGASCGKTVHARDPNGVFPPSVFQERGRSIRPIVSTETISRTAGRDNDVCSPGKSRWTHATACLYADNAIGPQAL